MKQDLKDFAYLWAGGKDGDWALVGEVPSVIPYNRKTRSILVMIEDDEVFEQIVAKMLEAGCPMIRSL